MKNYVTNLWGGGGRVAIGCVTRGGAVKPKILDDQNLKNYMKKIFKDKSLMKLELRFQGQILSENLRKLGEIPPKVSDSIEGEF